METRRDLWVDGEPDLAWRLLTDPAAVEEWLGTGAILEPEVGGRVHATEDDRHWTGIVTEVDGPRRLTLTWFEHDSDETSDVEIDLTAHGTGTKIVIRERPVEFAFTSRRDARALARA